MRPVRNVFQKLSRTEQRREGVVAYLWYALSFTERNREYWMICRGKGFLAVVCFGSHPLPFPLSRKKARPATHSKTEKEWRLDAGSWWGGAYSHYRKKAWSFISHSIISGFFYCGIDQGQDKLPQKEPEVVIKWMSACITCSKLLELLWVRKFVCVI